MTLSILSALVFVWSSHTAPLSLADSARYYDKQNQFSRSLSLWEEVLEGAPRNFPALARAADLRLLLQGRGSARSLLVSALEQVPSGRFHREVLSKLDEIHHHFVSGDAQSLFLQGQARAVRGDCEGALGLVARGLALESDNFRLLEMQADCQRNRKDWNGWLVTATRMSELVPDKKKEAIGELHFFFGRPSKALRSASGSSPRELLVQGASLVELGRPERAVEVLSQLPSQGLNLLEGRARDYFLGRAFVESGLDRKGSPLLRRFIAESFRSPTEWDWDPYRLSDRLASARKLSRNPTDR